MSERPDRASGDRGTPPDVAALFAKFYPWVTLNEITSWLKRHYVSDPAATEAAPRIVALYHGAMKKGMEIGMRHPAVVGQDASSEPEPNTPNAVDAVAVREALAPFAALGGPDDGCAAAFPDLPDDVIIYENSGRCITAGHVRAARKLISGYYQHTPYSIST